MGCEMAISAVGTDYRIISTPLDYEDEAVIDHPQHVIWISSRLDHLRYAQVVRLASDRARQELDSQMEST